MLAALQSARSLLGPNLMDFIQSQASLSQKEGDRGWSSGEEQELKVGYSKNKWENLGKGQTEQGGDGSGTG